MTDYIEMKLRKTGETVRVYNLSIDGTSSQATIFSPNLAGKQQGNGWQTVKISALVPIDFWVDDGFCSKTKKNKIKSRLKLISAEWQCTDGTVYTHEYLEDAIVHEAELMGEELEEEKGE
jgi:hypothetical protein